VHAGGRSGGDRTGRAARQRRRQFADLRDGQAGERQPVAEFVGHAAHALRRRRAGDGHLGRRRRGVGRSEAAGEHAHDRVGPQSPQRERQRLPGGLVHPVCIVDDDDKHAVARRQRAGERDQPGPYRQRARGVSFASGDPAQDRRQLGRPDLPDQLDHHAESQRRFPFRAAGGEQARARRPGPAGERAQQRGLADAVPALDEDDRQPAPPGRGQPVGQEIQFGPAPGESTSRRRAVAHRAFSRPRSAAGSSGAMCAAFPSVSDDAVIRVRRGEL
jgi:hypothetical protein